ncbi:ABC transporter substrate-binding protein [Streptomyces megasporus]|uniref:ABC transporter substrate-binding protein n=1 Tax=Streptomyces megasporus TaxID=44060 RepID=UPI0004E101F5|nr:ABC transporter substrate-binding protein [Streptomyces megasporus]
MARSRAALRTLIASALLVPLAACGSADGGENGKDRGAAPVEGFPLTVTNCGVETVFDAPPERAVTMNQHTTEILLALGLRERMAGTAYLDDAISPKYREDYEEVTVLAEEYPSKEVLLGANPDFVYGGYASAFDKAAGRDRAFLEGAGIGTRLNVESCADGPVGLDELETEITEVARVFGVPERGAALLEEQRRRIERVEKRLADVAKPTVFVYDSGDSSAFTAGGHGIGNQIISAAGGENVFADLADDFGDVSWEQVIKRAPEVIVIHDYGGTTVEAKKKRLLGDPALADVPAIRDERFAVLPLSSAVLGVRVADAVESLAEQLHPAAG